MSAARKRLLQRMFRVDGGLFDHEVSAADRRVLLRLAKAGVVKVADRESGFLFYLGTIKGGKAA